MIAPILPTKWKKLGKNVKVGWMRLCYYYILGFVASDVLLSTMGFITIFPTTWEKMFGPFSQASNKQIEAFQHMKDLGTRVIPGTPNGTPLW